MPIKDKSLYPKNWTEISHSIRFGRAKGQCERCGRHHGITVLVCEDGEWIDPENGAVYDGETGEHLGYCRMSEWPDGKMVKTVLTCAHLDHDPANNDPANLAALCQRCHLRHDRQQHIQSARQTRRSRKAIRDLFDD